MNNFFRFLKNALNYKVRLTLALIGIVGTNIFQFASLGTVVPLFTIVIGKGKIQLPENAAKYLPDFLMGPSTQLIDKINSIAPADLLLPLCIFILCATLCRGLFEVMMKISMESVAQNVMRDMMTELYHKIQILPVQFFTKMRTGELISRVTNDVNTVQAAMTARFTDNVAQVVQIPVSVAIMLLTYPKLTIFAAIAFPLILGPIVIIGRRLRKISKKTQEKIADITSILQETISGIRIIRAFNMEKYEIGMFNHQADKFCKLRIKAVKRSALVSPITEMVGVTCILSVALYLIKPALNNPDELGTIALYAGAMLVSIKPFRCVGKINNIIQRSVAALKRIYDLLDQEIDIKEIPDAPALKTFAKEMSFKNVKFNYDKDSDTIIKDFNLDVKAGEMIALVGSSGSGKTTLVNLIPRFFDVTAGSISIDGVDIRNVTFKSLRDQIGMVTQETFLFNDSIKNNIAYGSAEINQENVERAAQAANAHDFILAMPEAYDTVIGERGVLLSGGQRQRLAIARAIYKDPQILILDEATSALDTESERLVQEAIDRLVENRTVFAIAHRLSTIQHADRILVMSDGKIAQIGSHNELLSDVNGIYRKLHDMQFKNNVIESPEEHHKLIDIKKDKFKHQPPK